LCWIRPTVSQASKLDLPTKHQEQVRFGGIDSKGGSYDKQHFSRNEPTGVQKEGKSMVNFLSLCCGSKKF
jgi:hypothetical protein